MNNQVVVRSSIVLTGATFVLVAGACSPPPQETAEVIRPIKIETVYPGGAGRTQEYAGQVAATETADIGFEVSGRVVELAVAEGQDVNQGALLARLDPADFQSSLERAEADHRASEATFRRFESLAETGAISRQQLDDERRNYEVAVADLETARKALSDTRLLAPFAGNIGRRYIDNFVNVQAKEPVVLLQNLGALEVVVAVPEQDWSRAKPGRTYEEATALLSPVAILSTFPGREFALTFSEVATVADPVTRTFEIRLTLDRPEDITVMPGMTANVRITTPPPDSEDDAPIVLPTAAVFGNDQGGSSVWLVDPDTMTVSERVVELGPLTANGVDIVAGLTAGDRIAVSGVGNLREGMQVSEFER